MKKYVIITGGSTGLGYSLAKKLGTEGYTPILIARRKDNLENAQRKLEKLGIDSIIYDCDVRDKNRLKEIYNEVSKITKVIDFLILNAGVVNVGLIKDQTNLDKFIEDVEIDLIGSMLVTNVFINFLKEKSKVLFISSTLGLVGVAGYSSYCAAKAGVIAFADSLKRELYHSAVDVYVACPADMDTPQYHQEQKDMPNWMKGDMEGRSYVMPPDQAAEKILSRCKKGNYVIYTSNDKLRLAACLWPRKFKNYVLDLLFPPPKI